MNIEIEQVKLKNFLSFGSKWQTVPFLRGLNVIIGLDLETGRSNGAGKSSLMESIPYGLFGQVHRNIRKEQIVNWKNRKGCEVQLDFTKNENKYKVIRGIKPDKFEIYKNTILIDKPSHVKEYQKILDDILGLNYTTFMSIIHSNINSSIKILSMKKPEKRKFLEKMFGLNLYTKLNESSNSKLKNINVKIREIEISNDYKEKSIVESEQRIRSLRSQLKGLSISKTSLNEAQEKLEELEAKAPEIDKSELDWKINNSLFIISAYEKLNITLFKKIYNVKTWMKNNDERIQEYEDNKVQLKKRAELIKKLNALVNKDGDFETLTNLIKNMRTESSNYDKQIEKITNKISKIKSNITIARSEIGDKQKAIHLLQDDKCPTCGGDLSDGKLLNTFKEELTYTYDHEEKLLDILNEEDKQKEYYYKLRSNISSEIRKMEDKINLNYNTKNMIVDVVGSDIDIERLKRSKDRYIKTLQKLNNLLKKIEDKIVKENRTFTLLEEEKETIQRHVNKVIDQEVEVKRIKDKIENEIKLQENLNSLLEKDKQNIKLLEKEMKSTKIMVMKYNEMKDYLNHIKFVCKDENIKQYAISSIMPFLNKYTNKYLSKVGYGFYVTLDKWLDATINGPGITKASYGSLSGGEGRGIDIAIQLAFLDIDRLQAGVFFDLLVFDELLDSSIDEKGIQELFDIVKNKQREDDAKVFIISHRKELKNYDEIDNEYFVQKKDGYSEVIIK